MNNEIKQEKKDSQYFKKVKTRIVFIPKKFIQKFMQHWGNKKSRLFILLGALFVVTIFIYFYVLIPNTKIVQAPAIVASSDSDSLANFSVKIESETALRITASFNSLNKYNWSYLQVQAPENAEEVEVIINNDSLSKKVIHLSDSLRIGNYLKLTNSFLSRYTNLSDNFWIQISYIMRDGFYRKSFSKYFLSILFISVNKQNKQLPISVEVLAPQSFLLSSSIPDAYRIFVIPDGVSYTVSVIPQRTGILLYFDNLQAEANREIILLFITTILGFIIGMVLDKIFNPGNEAAANE